MGSIEPLRHWVAIGLGLPQRESNKKHSSGINGPIHNVKCKKTGGNISHSFSLFSFLPVSPHNNFSFFPSLSAS